MTRAKLGAGTAENLPDTMLIGDLHFAVQESTRRATVGITVDRDGSLILHAPPDCPPTELAAWARTKRMWVYRKLAEKDLLLSSRPAKEFVTGEGFAYLGRSYRLLVADVNQVRMERGRLLLPRASAEAARAALIGWYRHRGHRWLPGRMRPWASRMALNPAGLDVRDLGYRWGSLSTSGRVNIHWATLQLPPSLVDYVLVHELAHLAHPQHTPAFWATVERALPDYERRKNDLLTTGAELWLG
ncbi:MAG: M48 family metallopeptidase [Micromonosporaceae bacterium]|nr:M48 family metallopeptidase [Micromonosporaceae bacterium]